MSFPKVRYTLLLVLLALLTGLAHPAQAQSKKKKKKKSANSTAAKPSSKLTPKGPEPAPDPFAALPQLTLRWRGAAYPTGKPLSASDTLRLEVLLQGKPCPACILEDLQVRFEDASGQTDSLLLFKRIAVRDVVLPLFVSLRQSTLRRPKLLYYTVYGVEHKGRFYPSYEVKQPAIATLIEQGRY